MGNKGLKLHTKISCALPFITAIVAFEFAGHNYYQYVYKRGECHYFYNAVPLLYVILKLINYTYLHVKETDLRSMFNKVHRCHDIVYYVVQVTLLLTGVTGSWLMKEEYYRFGDDDESPATCMLLLEDQVRPKEPTILTHAVS